MHTAASFGRIRIMEWLKREGLDLNAKNDKGETPYDVAATKTSFDEMYDKKGAAEWLKQQLADCVVKVEAGNQQVKNTGAAVIVQSASYEDYLRELGHTTANVFAEKIVPLENKKKSLSEELEKLKHEYNRMSARI
jgi:hypothetical protein